MTNKLCKPHEINAYDSMRTGDVCNNTKEAIAMLVKSTKLTFPQFS